MVVPAFSLRIRQDWLRELVREVAAQENISQNELLEQAAEHEVIARGALIAEDLVAAARSLAALSEAAHEELVESSVVAFGVGEGAADPLRVHQITRTEASASGSEDLVAVTAFAIGR